MNSSAATMRLGDIGSVKMCKRILKHQTSQDATVPFYKISTFGGVPDTFIHQDIYDEYKRKYSYPKVGDILISAAGTVGKTVIFDGKPSYFQDSNIVWIDHDESVVTNRYLYYFYKTEPWRTTNGSTITRIYNENLRDIEVPVLPMGQQKKIAGVLSVLDDKIELNRKINAELEQMARTLYDYWFVQFDFPDASGKPYKSSGGKMAYNDQLKREIPTGWTAVQLKDLLNKRTGSAEPNSNLKCIDLSVMPSGSLSIDNFSAGDAFSSNMKKMYKNDILFGSIRPYLKKAGLAPFDGLRAGTVHAFYSKKREHLEFCLITMTSERYFDYAVNRSGGSTRMPSISSDDLLDYNAPFNEGVYFKYHEALTSFTDAISNNIQQSQKLAELRDWLLPMLMNGQVSVK